ncbi:MAG: mechanosensitive ion channel family protein [Chloroflexi bacterium]|nr:mechanosensitive ion channel family protein [Chloroflexota bacterium]
MVIDLREWLPFLAELPGFAQRILLDLFPFFFAALLIWLLRWLLTKLLLKPLRIVVSRSESQLDDSLVEACISPLRVAVVGFSLILVTLLFSFSAEVVQIAQAAGRSLLIGSIFFAIIRLFEVVSLQPVAFERLTGITIPERLLPFLNTLLKFLILALGAIFILQELNFDVAALIASLGVVGIGISLASQNTVSNMFGFAAIVSDNPFKVGDFIRTPSVSGIVESVGVRSTRIRQLDQALVSVPNHLLTDAVVVNWSRMQKRRLDLTLTFTYSTSSEQMRALLEEVRTLLQNTDEVDADSIMVHFIDMSASSLDVRIICQVLNADFRAFTAQKELILLEIMGIAERLEVNFAFPSQSLYIESLPGAPASAIADAEAP